MPRRAARELALLEQHDVLHAELGEVIGGRDAGDAAADDDGAGLAWEASALVGQSFSAATPATTLAAPARRGQPKPSLSHTAPMSAANSTDVSRSAATAAIGARVIAQSTMA